MSDRWLYPVLGFNVGAALVGLVAFMLWARRSERRLDVPEGALKEIEREARQ